MQQNHLHVLNDSLKSDHDGVYEDWQVLPKNQGHKKCKALFV